MPLLMRYNGTCILRVDCLPRTWEADYAGGPFRSVLFLAARTVDIVRRLSMKRALVLFGLLALTGIAYAGHPPIDVINGYRADDSCELGCVTFDWDFAVGDQGFTYGPCDDTGGEHVWEYGTTTYVPVPDPCWGTVLDDDYLDDSGEALLSPAFTVTDEAYLMEVYHYIHTENVYDGCNVSVNGEVIEPYTPYPEQLNPSGSYYAFCVDEEQGWTGYGYQGAFGWSLDCFDLSQFMDQEIVVEFNLGSDSSVNYPGWYIQYVRVGTPDGTPVEDTTWGRIKGLFQ